MRILLTGGLGFIGSHIAVRLLELEHDVIIVDNLSNSSPLVLDRVEGIAGRRPVFHKADMRDADALHDIFGREAPEAVIHLAGAKAVEESVRLPLDYYENNIAGSLVLYRAMALSGVKRLIFSSSATVYGLPMSVPVAEDHPLTSTNPYGRTKLHNEEILKDIQNADPEWRVVLLRYFNPVGAHPSGAIGEDYPAAPANLMPCIAWAAAGRLPQVRIYGTDYPTRDGTGVRDFIHVDDLARAHVAAIDAFALGGLKIYNVGTGRGYSVREILTAYEEVVGRPIPHVCFPRRPGDIPEIYADPGLIERELGWRAEKGLTDMVADSWRWQSANPDGYKS